MLGFKIPKIVYAKVHESLAKIGDVNRPKISKLFALKFTVTPEQEASNGH